MSQICHTTREGRSSWWLQTFQFGLYNKAVHLLGHKVWLKSITKLNRARHLVVREVHGKLGNSRITCKVDSEMEHLVQKMNEHKPAVFVDSAGFYFVLQVPSGKAWKKFKVEKQKAETCWCSLDFKQFKLIACISTKRSKYIKLTTHLDRSMLMAVCLFLIWDRAVWHSVAIPVNIYKSQQLHLLQSIVGCWWHCNLCNQLYITCGYVDNPDGAVCHIDMLTTRSTGTHSSDLQILGRQLDIYLETKRMEKIIM